MKKKLSLCFTLLLASLLAIICAFKFSPSASDSKTQDTQTLKRTNFVNRLTLDQDFALQLFYADASMSQIESFTLTADSLNKEPVALASYSEGFLTQTENEHLLDVVNTLRATQGKKPLSYFYHYQKIGDYAFASSSEGLDSLYFIDLNTFSVDSPILRTSEATTSQYVYHIQAVDDYYVILTAGFHALDARLYTFSPLTLELSLIATSASDATALSSKQYVLNAQGAGLLTHEKGIQILAQIETPIIDLTFTPQMLISNESLSSALAIEGHTLHYALVNNSFEVVDTGTLTLPNANLSLIHSFIVDDFLYTVTYDPTHPTYKHYISIYQLSKKELIFCEGLSSSDDLALLNVVFLGD